MIVIGRFQWRCLSAYRLDRSLCSLFSIGAFKLNERTFDDAPATQVCSTRQTAGREHRLYDLPVHVWILVLQFVKLPLGNNLKGRSYRRLLSEDREEL
jgi:hypothetical protein